jgi:hypothetical protein
VRAADVILLLVVVVVVVVLVGAWSQRFSAAVAVASTCHRKRSTCSSNRTT